MIPPLSREQAKGYQKTLNPHSQLYTELSRKLMIHQLGIFSLSNGIKVHATQFRLLGGGLKPVGDLLITVLNKENKHISKDVRNIAIAAWKTIFSDDTVESVEDNKLTVARFIDKLSQVGSDQKPRVQYLLNKLHDDLEKAIQEKDSEILEYLFEDMQTTLRRLAKHKGFLGQINQPKTIESKESGLDNQARTDEDKRIWDEVVPRDTLSLSLQYGATAQKLKLKHIKNLENKLQTLEKHKRITDQELKKQVKENYKNFENEMKQAFPEDFYESWLGATFFREYSYFFGELFYKLKSRSRDRL